MASPSPKQFGVLGLSYKTAPVDLRERLAIDPASLAAVVKWVRSLGAEETVVLGTCNRVEIYWSAPAEASLAPALVSAWSRQAGRPLESHIYLHQGLAAATHLFRVASGLDSMVLGEPQILGQVKTAYQTALSLQATGPRLNRLFQRALQAGKKVRTETDIASGITSVASAAVVLAERIFASLSQCAVLILGAGKMAETAGRHLASCKTKSLWVANRTWEKAQALAGTLGAEPLPWETGLARLPEVDIVLCSTASQQPVIRADSVREWMQERRGRPLFFIDIAVPRNVDPVVNGIDNVYLYDIDDLKCVVAEQTLHKQAAAEAAEALARQLAEEAFEALTPAHLYPALVWRKDYA